MSASKSPQSSTESLTTTAALVPFTYPHPVIPPVNAAENCCCGGESLAFDSVVRKYCDSSGLNCFSIILYQFLLHDIPKPGGGNVAVGQQLPIVDQIKTGIERRGVLRFSGSFQFGDDRLELVLGQDGSDLFYETSYPRTLPRIDDVQVLIFLQFPLPITQGRKRGSAEALYHELLRAGCFDCRVAVLFE